MRRLAGLVVLSLPLAGAGAIAGEAGEVTALRGEFLDNGEVIHGVLESAGEGRGRILMELSGLAVCHGEFRRAGTAGEGPLACSDNRRGSFAFVRDGAGGIGCGTLQPGTGTFRFVLGETAFLAGYPAGLSCAAGGPAGKKN